MTVKNADPPDKILLNNFINYPGMAYLILYSAQPGRNQIFWGLLLTGKLFFSTYVSQSIHNINTYFQLNISVMCNVSDKHEKGYSSKCSTYVTVRPMAKYLSMCHIFICAVCWKGKLTLCKLLYLTKISILVTTMLLLEHKRQNANSL